MIEIAQKAFEKHGIGITYRTIPWARALDEVRDGRVTAVTGAAHGDAPDFIFPAIAQAQSQMAFFVPVDSQWTYTAQESLESISLGTIVDYSYDEATDAYIAKYAEDMKRIQTVSGDEGLALNVKKLLKRRIGALIEDKNVVEYYLQQNGLSGQIKKAGALPAGTDQNLYIAFSPAVPESSRYAELLSQETKVMWESGELEAIFAKYGLSLPEEHQMNDHTHETKVLGTLAGDDLSDSQAQPSVP